MTEPASDRVFLDASYAIALVNIDDALHRVALALAQHIAKHRTTLVTTRPVLLEIGDGLSKPRYRQVASELLASIDRDPKVEIVELTETLYHSAFELYRGRQDKGWGMTDCVSFIVMRSQGMTDALTHDIHFEQAGLRALMR
jgi:predicted nucleic acid-binding protein